MITVNDYDPRELPGVKQWLDGDIDFYALPQGTVDALYEYYSDEMPYGVAKARTGEPDEWIEDRLRGLA